MKTKKLALMRRRRGRGRLLGRVKVKKNSLRQPGKKGRNPIRTEKSTFRSETVRRMRSKKEYYAHDGKKGGKTNIGTGGRQDFPYGVNRNKKSKKGEGIVYAAQREKRKMTIRGAEEKEDLVSQATEPRRRRKRMEEDRPTRERGQ